MFKTEVFDSMYYFFFFNNQLPCPPRASLCPVQTTLEELFVLCLARPEAQVSLGSREHVCMSLFVLYLAQNPSDYLVHEDGDHVLSAPLYMLSRLSTTH